MSYSYTPVNAGAAALAAYAAQLAANVTGTPAPIPVPGGTDGFLVAFADAIVGAAGFQIESNNAVGTISNGGSTTYADIAGSSITFTAPLAKIYVVHCDTAIEFSTLGSGGFLRLVVNGNNGPDIFVQDSVVSIHRNVHLMHAASCIAGANTIKLQWKTNVATGVINMSGDVVNYIVSG